MSGSDRKSGQFPRKFGKYHLLGPLAQGGMGALYLATTGDRGLERMLVVKTVLPHLADVEYVARFRDEAKVVVKLSHGNLIPVFDAGQVGGELFVAMDFVEGKDLRAVWNRCAKQGVAFPVDVAVYIVKELCRGLGYAHSYEGLELVHRDVSPPNVLVSYAGEVKLTDFGLASSTLKLEKTAPGIIYGKVAYMSPEQARGDKLDGRSDLYAAGIILWELLTGRQLFPPGQEQPQDLIERARAPEVEAPSNRAPRVGADLDALVLKALAADRDARFSSCNEFRDALNEWLAENSPSTDASTLEEFTHRLFANDIGRDRAARAALIAEAREKVKTLPPADELRHLLDNARVSLLQPSDRRQLIQESVDAKRRAIDVGESPGDRRRRLSRRAGDTSLGAVSVPAPGEGGKTVVTVGGGESAAASAPALVHASLVGQVVDGRYQVGPLVGEGGMGRVYQAEHVEIGRRVALKVLHPVYSRMPDLVERFRREARAASKIGHPNIVDVTDSGTTGDGSVYFAMEFLEGLELAAVIDREGALEVKRSLRIAIQICRALSAAHAAGIIHRDLKPENVFLTVRDGSNDFVKVLDFGIAKTAEAEEARSKKLTHPGMAMGTPEYMAPEQAAGKPADQRCDVYAVGAILHEMLTGTPPYVGDNFMEILTKKATIEPRPVRELQPSVSQGVADLVQRAMAREPGDRPPSMEAFEYELTKCLSGRQAAVANRLGLRQNRATDRLGSGHSDTPLVLGTEPGRERRVPAPLPDSASLATSPNRTSSARRLAWLAGIAMVLAGFAAFVALAPGDKERRVARAAQENGLGTGEYDGGGAQVVEGNAPQAALPISPERTEAADNRSSRGLTVRSTRSESSVRGADDAEVLLREADGHMANLEYEQAKSKYRRVADGKYLARKGNLGLGHVAFQQQDYDEAIRWARKAGDGVDALVLAGNAFFRRGDYAEALEAYESALVVRPSHREAQKAARSARKKLGI